MQKLFGLLNTFLLERSSTLWGLVESVQQTYRVPSVCLPTIPIYFLCKRFLFYLFLLIFSSCDPLPSHLPLHLRCLIGSCGFRMDFVMFRWRKCCFEQPLQNLLFQEGIRRERRDKRPSNRMTFVISDGPFLSGLGKIPNILQNRTI